MNFAMLKLTDLWQSITAYAGISQENVELIHDLAVSFAWSAVIVPVALCAFIRLGKDGFN